MSSRTNRKQKRTSNRSWGMVNVGLTILYAILALVLLFTMFNYNFLSFRFLNIIITIGLLVVLAISIFLQKTKKFTTSDNGCIGYLLASFSGWYFWF